MEEIRRFSFKNLEELKCILNKYELSVSDNINCLMQEIKIGDKIIPNRILAHPMEGVDALNFSPSNLTYRKYERIAKGGYGTIWVEATSVCEEGMSNDHQLLLNNETFEGFKKLNNLIKKKSKESAFNREAYTILQLNHSGRYCNKNKKENAKIATHREELDIKRNIEHDRELISDEYLENLKIKYLNAAILAKKAGFDSVDIKSCHGYLVSELLGARDRNGKYGGKLENRFRFLLEVIDLIKTNKDCKGLDISVRLNASDMTKNGFSTDDNLEPDLSETYKLVELLKQKGIKLISITLGNPYFIPNINKPYDLNNKENLESPLISCIRAIKIVKDLQMKYKDIFFVGIGFSWFRQYSVNLGEWMIENKFMTLLGFGRQSLAYPNLGNDLKHHGYINKSNSCITCNGCSNLKANFLPAGCVIRDSEIYGKYYKKIRDKI
ncbi:MAG: hypothetical protein Q4B23_05300 [Helcococcus sp.]|nr:hypothetical protein [Helcococcus sp.]